jgi:hypothetical protein
MDGGRETRGRILHRQDAVSEPENIVRFPVDPRTLERGKTCATCKGKGVEAARIGRMYSEITCRACRGSGKERP